MHLTDVDKLVHAMKIALQEANGKPVVYQFYEQGLQFGAGDKTISSVVQLGSFRAEVELALGVEGDEEEPEGL